MLVPVIMAGIVNIRVLWYGVTIAIMITAVIGISVLIFGFVAGTMFGAVIVLGIWVMLWIHSVIDYNHRSEEHLIKP